MLRRKVVVLLVLLQFTVSECARILAVAPLPSYSHQVAFRPIWKELSLRGHHVTLITTDPIRDASLRNLTEIDVHDVTYDIWRRSGIIQLMQQNQRNPLTALSTFLEVFTNLTSAIMNDEAIKGLMSNDTNFDLVMIEPLLPVGFGFAEHYKSKLIFVMSMEAPSYLHIAMGNPYHPVLYPEAAVPIKPDSYFTRILSTAFSAYYSVFQLYFFDFTTNLLRQHFGKNVSPLQSILDRANMLFANVNPIFAGIRPLTSSTILFGRGSHLQPEKPLPSDIKSYLDEAENGVVYFSLGSNVLSKDLSEDKKRILLDTFAELPFRFLWKFEDESLKNLPENVKVWKWIPQQDVLRHPNVRVFITQGGLQSTEEAIFSKVPIIGMPQIADQQTNINRVVELGMGVQADFENLNKEDLKRIILDVASNKSYRENMENFVSLSTDWPMNGIEEVVWWTEYVLRHNSTEHLKGPARNIPTYQYLLLDVIGTTVLIVFVVTYLFFKLGKCMIRILVGRFHSKSHTD